MKDEEFRLHGRIEDEHWWFVGKRQLLRALLRPYVNRARLLDIGCGTGGVLREFGHSSNCVGVDRSALALEICAEKGLDRLVRADSLELPFGSAAFDILLALDVIEHLDDDVEFLRRASRLCSPRGRVLVSVPAFQFLWSQHDETFEHRRRYSSRSLTEVVCAAGLIPERTTYTNLFVFPVAALWRPLSYRLGLGRLAPRTDFWRLPRFLNAVLVWAYKLEARMLVHTDLPVGLSVVCIARRP